MTKTWPYVVKNSAKGGNPSYNVDGGNSCRETNTTSLGLPPKRRRLTIFRRNAAKHRLFSVHEKFCNAGKSSGVLDDEGKTMELAVSDRTRTTKRLAGRMEKDLTCLKYYNEAFVVKKPLNDAEFTGDAERLNVASDDEEKQPVGQEDLGSKLQSRKLHQKISEQKVAADDDELEKIDFECRKYREGDVIEKEFIEKYTQSLELTAGTIETVQARFSDEIKPVVGLYPDEWSDAQRDKARWYPIQLDGRAMSITRHSGAIEYIVIPGTTCAKEDSDVQVAMNALAANLLRMRGFVFFPC